MDQQLPLFTTDDPTTDKPAVPRPRRGRPPVPADPAEHARRIATTVDAAWRSHHGSGTDLHIPTGVVAALSLLVPTAPDGSDLADHIAALDPAALGQFLRNLWRAFIINRPDLGPRLAPLIAWLYREPSDWDLAGAHTVAAAALRSGQLQLTGDRDRRHAVDLFAEVLQIMRGVKAKADRGAYYTPQPVADVLARMSGVGLAAPGESICDPAAGTGIMFWAAAKILRDYGKDPADYRWYGNDIDTLAAACLAVNAHLWGLGHQVVIGAFDGLDPRWPHYAEVDRATAVDVVRWSRAFATVNALITDTTT